MGLACIIITMRYGIVQTMDRLKKALNDNGIEHSEKRFETEEGIQSLGENPFVCHIINIIFHACMKQAFKYKMICLRSLHGNNYTD